MDGNASDPHPHPLGTVTKDDVVIVNNLAFIIVAGTGSLLDDGSLVGNFETQTIPVESADDLHDDGLRVFEISGEFVGQWR